MAIGGGGQIPKMPTYPDFVLFSCPTFLTPLHTNKTSKSLNKGTALHSVSFKNASSWKDKHGIVIGSANIGHDIAEDMLASGLRSVTMVQRSPTYVVPAEYIGDVIKHSYNADVPTVVADQASWSMPYPVLAQLYNGNVRHRSSMEPERFDALEKAGFKLERNGQLAVHIFERFGGHYLDVGASKKIVDGKVRQLDITLCYENYGATAQELLDQDKV
jgi:hypothetical protein